MAVCGGFALEEAVDLSQGRLQNEFNVHTRMHTYKKTCTKKKLYQSKGYFWILFRVKISKKFRTFKFAGMLLRADW